MIHPAYPIMRRHLRRMLLILLLTAPCRAEAQLFNVLQLNQNSGLPQNGARHLLLDNRRILWVITEDGLCYYDGRSVIKVPTPLRCRLIGIAQYGPDTIMATDDNQDACLITRYHSIAAHGPAARFGSLLSNTNKLVRAGAASALHTANYQLGGFRIGDTTLIWDYGRFDLYVSGRYLQRVPAPGDYISFFAQSGSCILLHNRDKNRLDIYNTRGFLGSYALPRDFAGKARMLPAAQDTSVVYLSVGPRLYAVRTGQGRSLQLSKIMDNFRFSNETTDICALDDDYLVAGTTTNGIIVYSRKQFVTSFYPDETSSVVNQVLMPDRHTILTPPYFLHRQNGPVRKFPHPEIQKDAILRTRSGTYWWAVFSHNKNYLCSGSTPGQPLRQYGTIDEQPKYIFEDREGIIWVLSNNELVRVDHNGKTWHTRLEPYGLVHSGQLMRQGGDGQLWLGTRQGLYRLDTSGRPVYCALKGTYIETILPDDSLKGLWLGTYGQGLFWLDLVTGKTTRFPGDGTGALKIIHHIVPDRLGRMWFPTNNGLLVTEKTALTAFLKNSSSVPYFYRFDISDGLRSNEFNGPGGANVLCMPDGTITCSSMAGVVWFNPANIRFHFSRDSLYLAYASVDGHEVLPGHELELNEGADLLKLRFVASYLGQAEKNEYEYCLQDTRQAEDSSWQPLPVSGNIEFSHLAAAQYNLVFRKRTAFSNSAFLYQRYAVTVIPKWYHRTWFYIAVLVFMVAISVSIILARQYIHRKRMKVMANKVNRITHTLRLQNDKLEQTNQFREKLISVLVHDLSIPVYYFNATLERLTRDAMIPEHIVTDLRKLHNEGSLLEIFANDLLSWVRVQNGKGGISVDRQWVDLKKLIRQRWALFAARAEAKGIQLADQTGKEANVFTDPRILSVIIHNVLDNSIKFLQGGFIRVAVSYAGNGEAWSVVFEEAPDDETVSGDSSQPGAAPFPQQAGRGFGIHLIKDFSAILGIDYFITTNSNGSVNSHFRYTKASGS